MSTRNRSLFEIILARISRGQVPVDGSYWSDPSQRDPKTPRPVRIPDPQWSPMSVSLFRPVRRAQRKSA